MQNQEFAEDQNKDETANKGNNVTPIVTPPADNEAYKSVKEPKQDTADGNGQKSQNNDPKPVALIVAEKKKMTASYDG